MKYTLLESQFNRVKSQLNENQVQKYLEAQFENFFGRKSCSIRFFDKSSNLTTLDKACSALISNKDSDSLIFWYNNCYWDTSPQTSKFRFLSPFVDIEKDQKSILNQLFDSDWQKPLAKWLEKTYGLKTRNILGEELL